jgi:uncharacterized protein YndB with AHSA1/START domain
MNDATSREITLTRIVDAPCDLVFKAWTEAEHLQRWWGPDGFTVSSASSDPREGGAFEIVMHGPDGNDYPLTGTYREFKPPHRIVSDMTASGPDGAPALQAVATLTFVDHDGKTEITVHERADALIPEAALMLAGMEIGMVQSLRRLDDFLTGAADRQIVLTRMLEAPRDVVFDAWTSHEHLQHWYGPNGFTITTEAIDVRPGGVWTFTMHGPDGVDYPNELAYEQVVRPELLTFEHRSPGTDDPGFFGSVSFDDFMGNTVLTMRSVFPSKGEMDRVVERYGAIEGGNQTLDRLAAYVATV